MVGCTQKVHFMEPGYYFKNSWINDFEGLWESKNNVALKLKFNEKSLFYWNDTIYYQDKIVGDFCFENNIKECNFDFSKESIYIFNGDNEKGRVRVFLKYPKYETYREGHLDINYEKNSIGLSLLAPSVSLQVAGEKNWGKSSIADSTSFQRIIN